MSLPRTPEETSRTQKGLVELSLSFAEFARERFAPSVSEHDLREVLRSACLAFWPEKDQTPEAESRFVESAIGQVAAQFGELVSNDFDTLTKRCFTDDEERAAAFLWREVLRAEPHSRVEPESVSRLRARMTNLPFSDDSVPVELDSFDREAYARYGYGTDTARGERSPLVGLRAAAEQAELCIAFQWALRDEPDREAARAELFEWAKACATEIGIPPVLFKSPRFDT